MHLDQNHVIFKIDFQFTVIQLERQYSTGGMHNIEIIQSWTQQFHIGNNMQT